jgi:hypothetical protein
LTRTRGLLVAVVVAGALAALAIPRLHRSDAAASPGGLCSSPVLTTSSDGALHDGGFVVDQDMWNNHSGSQVLRACSYRSWTVTATQPDTAESPDVNTYPHVWRAFSSPTVDSFREIDSRFATRGPATGVYDFTYDVWIGGIATDTSTELMVWTHNHGNTLHVPMRGTFSSGGVTYDLYHAGRFIAFVGSDRDRGSVDLLALFRYAVSRGWLSGSSTVSRIEFGVEVCKTGARPLEFAVTDYALTAR